MIQKNGKLHDPKFGNLYDPKIGKLNGYNHWI